MTSYPAKMWISMLVSLYKGSHLSFYTQDPQDPNPNLVLSPTPKSLIVCGTLAIFFPGGFWKGQNLDPCPGPFLAPSHVYPVIVNEISMMS